MVGESYCVIGDIAGRFDELQLLLDKMPEGYILAVGDLCDRGPKSREVIEFFIDLESQDKGDSIFGNHEHLMLDHFCHLNIYQPNNWIYNGGGKTLESFNHRVPEEVVDWISRRPLYKKIQLEDQEVVISHSFVHPDLNLEEAVKIAKKVIPWNHPDFDRSIIWNREYPIRRDYLQIVGHNSQMKLRQFNDDKGLYAINLDDSANKKLTGLHLPSMEVFQQEYL